MIHTVLTEKVMHQFLQEMQELQLKYGLPVIVGCIFSNGVGCPFNSKAGPLIEIRDSARGDSMASIINDASIHVLEGMPLTRLTKV